MLALVLAMRQGLFKSKAPHHSHSSSCYACVQVLDDIANETAMRSKADIDPGIVHLTLKQALHKRLLQLHSCQSLQSDVHGFYLALSVSLRTAGGRLRNAILQSHSVPANTCKISCSLS